jgi:hypothetical protein
MAFVTDPDDLAQGTEVVINTGTRRILLDSTGDLGSSGVTAADNGVTGQALYSFLKEEWKNDATLIPHPFPMVAITPEQFEFINDWELQDSTSREFVRTAGWSEVDSSNNVKAQYAGVISLGSLEDSVNDQLYYAFGNDPTDTAAAVNFSFPGALNEAIQTFNELGNPTGLTFNSSINFSRSTASGDFLTDGYVVGGQVTIRAAGSTTRDGTFIIDTVNSSAITVSSTEGTNFSTGTDSVAQVAVDNRNALDVFLRVRDGDTNGKTFAQADLATIGLTTLTNKAERFPLSNASDLKITTADAVIDSSSPWTEVEIRYFDQAYSREVDSTSKRNFGIVIDVGTHSGVDGVVASTGATVITTAEGTLSSATYAGGTITLHEGGSQGTYTISDLNSTSVTIASTTLPSTGTNISFTLQRGTPVSATAEQIYEKVQRQLRLAGDIDATDQIVNGQTADALLQFVGDNLNAGVALPTNPNGGGSGVIIEGFDSNDTNRLSFTDNAGTASITFPFVAAGSITFNNNLVNDADPRYWMFFEYTTRSTVSDLSVNAVTGSSARIESAAGNIPSSLFSTGEYIGLFGSTVADNNGIWQVTGAITSSGFTAVKQDLDTPSSQAGFGGTLDQNPIDSPSAIIVDNNSGTDIASSIATSPVNFDFDYDGNTQGGRTAGTDAAIVIRAIGLDTAQFVETSGTITRNTGLSFSLVSALERNYSNP